MAIYLSFNFGVFLYYFLWYVSIVEKGVIFTWLATKEVIKMSVGVLCVWVQWRCQPSTHSLSDGIEIMMGDFYFYIVLSKYITRTAIMSWESSRMLTPSLMHISHLQALFKNRLNFRFFICVRYWIWHSKHPNLFSKKIMRTSIMS